MIDTFSCIPFDLPHLIYSVELAIKYVFPLKSFYLSLKNSTLPATALRFLTLTYNLHRVTSFFNVMAVKTMSLDDVNT